VVRPATGRNSYDLDGTQDHAAGTILIQELRVLVVTYHFALLGGFLAAYLRRPEVGRLISAVRELVEPGTDLNLFGLAGIVDLLLDLPELPANIRNLLDLPRESVVLLD
jgi:hypothetical protein